MRASRVRMELLRTPMVLVGLLLTLIGAGNIYTGYVKTGEYEALLATRESSPGGGRLSSDPWRSPLLSHLKIEQSPAEAARSKRDFYRVVYTGGRLLTALGILCTASGAALFWYRHGRASPVRSASEL